MSHMRWMVLTAMVMLCALAAWAQPEPVKDLCVLQGTVKFTDGTPFPGITVAVVVDGKPIAPTPLTNDDGSYITAVPAGQATLTVAGTAKQQKLEAGKQNVVDFELAKDGVMVAVVAGDGVAMPNVNIRAMSRMPDNTFRDVNATNLGPGRFWYRGLPAGATSFSVVATYSSGYGAPHAIREQCPLANGQPMPRLTITFPKVVPLQVQVLDADRKPLGNAQVKGSLTSEQVQKMLFWDDLPNAVANNYMGYRSYPSEWRTDPNGILNLGSMHPRKYTLTLRSGTMAGPSAAFELKAGMAPLDYALSLKPRDVAQTVLGANGKPLPKTAVTIGYVWMNVISYQNGTTDAKGQVTWKAVPPVYAIVWGAGVAPGLLPPDAEQYATPLLPLPVSDPNNYRSRYLRLKFVNLGNQPTRIVYTTVSANSGTNTNELSYRPEAGGENTYASSSFSLDSRSSTPSFSLLAMTKSVPPRMAVFANMYLPPNDDNSNETSELQVSLEPGTWLKGRLVTKNGPVKGMSQFRVAPVKVASDLGALFTQDFQRRTGMLQARVSATGTFAVALPSPGTYRLVVDLYDEATPPLPELLVDVPVGGKEVEVKLPEPMLTVPAGTQVNWLTHASPAAPRALVAAAYANPTPLFAPRDQLLALWFRPTPDKLVLWNGLDRQQSMLALRAVTVTVVDETGNPPSSGYTYQLQPLLPGRNNSEYGYSQPMMSGARANSETATTSIAPDNAYCAGIWTGRYLIPTGSYGNNSIAKFVPVTIAADGPPEVTVTVNRTEPRIIGGNRSRSLTLRYGRGDYDQLRRSASESLMVAFDGASVQDADQTFSAYYLSPNSGGNMSVPLNAKTFTLYWPGVGIMRNVALPAYDPNRQWVVELPAWETLPAVSGKIVGTDGKPYQNRSLYAGASLANSSTNIRFQTDANGAFTLKGVLPGTFFISNTDYESRGGWILTVPDKGLADMTLAISSQTMRISGLPGSESGSQLWWFPDEGQPMRLPLRGGECALYDPPLGAGILWATDGYRGDGRYQRHAMRAGDVYLNSDGAQTPTGPTLGLYFPLEVERGTPGMVTLEGQGERANLRVRYRNIAWQASSALNRVVGQINAVPPGKYTVIVETATSIAEGAVTVGEYGGKVELTFPPAAAAPVAPAAP